MKGRSFFCITTAVCIATRRAEVHRRTGQTDRRTAIRKRQPNGKCPRHHSLTDMPDNASLPERNNGAALH